MAAKSSRRKYGPKASRKVKRAMQELKHGTLRSGRSGKKVKSRKQAIAIACPRHGAAAAKYPGERTHLNHGQQQMTSLC